MSSSDSYFIEFQYFVSKKATWVTYIEGANIKISSWKVYEIRGIVEVFKNSHLTWMSCDLPHT